jgi:hypothetical protein
MMALRRLIENCTNADLREQMIGMAPERPMELARIRVAHDKRAPSGCSRVTATVTGTGRSQSA